MTQYSRDARACHRRRCVLTPLAGYDIGTQIHRRSVMTGNNTQKTKCEAADRR